MIPYFVDMPTPLLGLWDSCVSDMRRFPAAFLPDLLRVWPGAPSTLLEDESRVKQTHLTSRNGQVNDWVKDEQDILHGLKVQDAFWHSHQPPPLCWVHNLSSHRVTRRGGKYLQIMLRKLSRESRTNSRRARETRRPRSLRAEPESATARHGMALMSQISS